MLSFVTMKNITIKFYKHFLIFAFFILLSNLLIDYFFKYQKKNYLSIQTETLQIKYETQYRYLRIMSNDVFLMYQDNKKFIDLFEQASSADKAKRTNLRTSIYKLLKKRYKRLSHMGIKHIHFYLPNNVSFLRMHAPSKFGDDLTKIRESVVLTNSTKKASECFEIGRISNGFRYVYPLYGENQQYIGSMEISFNSIFLLKNLTGKTILDKHFLILKSEVHKNSWRNFIASSYIDSVEDKDYFLAIQDFNYKRDKTINALLQNSDLIKKIKNEVETSYSFSIDAEFENKNIIITFLPIKNLHKKIAYIAVYENSEYLNRVFLERMYIKLLLFSIITLLFFFSIYVTIVHSKLKNMALIDKLTGLPNRAYFYAGLEKEIERVNRDKTNCSVMFIDLDGFKSVNDTFGHDAGDELLIQVASRLQDNIREIDIVGRIGGDEFIVLLTNMQDTKNTSKIAQKIIDALGTIFHIHQNNIQIGASIGISSYPEDALDIDTLVKNADDAMYQAKNSGKNHYVIYNKED